MDTASTAQDAPPAWRPPGLLTFIRFMLARIRWPWLLLPLVPAALLIGDVGQLPRREILTKDGFELLAIIVMSAAVGLALLRAVIERRAFFIWAAALAGSLLFREFHLHKSSTTITYICIIILAFIMWRAYDRLAAYFDRPRTPTLLAMMVTCYCLSQCLDFDYFKDNFSHLPIAEEVVEVMGHLCVLLMVITARATASPRLPQAALSPQSTPPET